MSSVSVKEGPEAQIYEPDEAVLLIADPPNDVDAVEASADLNEEKSGTVASWRAIWKW
jgi:hypothetical protein